MSNLTMNGFGMRCIDAIRNVDKPLNIKVNKDYSYEEIHYSEATCLLSLRNGLVSHMRKSPTYFYDKKLTINEFTEKCINRKSRFFIAKDKLEVVGYLEVTNSGETFITEEVDYLHICWAYLKKDAIKNNEQIIDITNTPWIVRDTAVMRKLAEIFKMDGKLFVTLNAFYYTEDKVKASEETTLGAFYFCQKDIHK